MNMLDLHNFQAIFAIWKRDCLVLYLGKTRICQLGYGNSSAPITILHNVFK